MWCDVIMEDFNAEAGKLVAGETAMGNRGVDLQEERGQTLADFAKNHSPVRHALPVSLTVQVK